MNAIENSLIPTELMAELQDAADKAARGIRDLQAAQEACKRMDSLRDKNHKLFGTQDVGVDIIREVRDTR